MAQLVQFAGGGYCPELKLFLGQGTFQAWKHDDGNYSLEECPSHPQEEPSPAEDLSPEESSPEETPSDSSPSEEEVIPDA
jgi:hypothetical protein